MNIYLRILKYMRPYWLKLAIAIVCMVIFAAANAALAYLIGPAMSVLFSGDMAARLPHLLALPFHLFAAPAERMRVIVPLAIVVIAVIKGLSSYGNTYYMGYVGQGVISDLRSDLYAHVLRLPLGYFTSNPTGGLTSRLTLDVNMLQKSTADALADSLKQSLTVIALIVIIIGMDWRFALVASLSFPVAIYPAIKLGRLMKKVSKKGQVTMGTMSSLLHEAISGVRIVKAFSMEDYESKRFEKENERFTKYSIKAIKVKGVSTPLMETVGAFGFAVTILYAAYRITSGTLTPEAFISFFAAVVMLYQPIKALNGVHLNVQQGLASAVRIFEVMDVPVEPVGEEGTAELRGFKDSIEFKGVDFSYGSVSVLKDINLRVRKGERIAVVGTSGAGKTTFVNLIPRFYDTTAGGVFIDGEDIRDMTLKSLRAQIAIVSQDVILFNDTAKNNIAYGDPKKAEEDVREAAIAANAHGFISRLPAGYDTVVGERGMKLSGGEKQRVSIARAILKNAPILIMDEATSSLDTESEYEVEKGLDNLMKNRTVFVIAHRLSTVKNADRIIVLSGGMIAESGTHEELLRRGGEYSRLYTMQFQGLKEGMA
ncbi:MAG: ATP-binding cassette domain-containing protein [Deltaproteobacteria bacterium]|nr:ATP-binding cassette domain-containing protein [Deltaproteobacteria bacterium]